MKNIQKNNEDLFEYSKDAGTAKLTLLKPATLEFSKLYEDSAAHPDLSDVTSLVLDCSNVKAFDTYFVIFSKDLEKLCKDNNVTFECTGLPRNIIEFMELLSASDTGLEKQIHRRRPIYNYFKHIGEGATNALQDAREFVDFLGELVIKIFRLIIHPTDMRWKDFPFNLSRSGVNALPIVLLILFLIGIVTGYQSAVQLHIFGADLMLADVIGISITMELGPLMTAILVAGRSGSSFAAEIGTMKVSEEIDALNSMGFDHIKFLVMPRVLAVTIAMPFLTLFADMAGIFGGLIAGLSALDITAVGYMNALQNALTYFGVFTGLAKSMVFGFLIATVGCFRGMQVRGGAESVGKFTTASVVTGIFLIILADAIFAFVLQAL